MFFYRFVQMSSRHNLFRVEAFPLSVDPKITACALTEMASVRVYQSFDALPPSYRDFFAGCGLSNYYLSGAWFERLFRTCARTGDSLRIHGNRPLMQLSLEASGWSDFLMS